MAKLKNRVLLVAVSRENRTQGILGASKLKIWG